MSEVIISSTGPEKEQLGKSSQKFEESQNKLWLLEECQPSISEPDEEPSAPLSPHPLSIQPERVACCSALHGLAALVRGPPVRRAPTLLEAPQPANKVQLQAAISSKTSVARKSEQPMVNSKTQSQSVGWEKVLSGRWVQRRFEGDMEQLMMDAKLPWAIRRLAKSLDYGNGKTFVTISQRDGLLEIVTELPTKSPSATAFEVGAPDFREVKAADAKALLVRVAWEGEVLAIERKSLSGKDLPTVFRYLDSATGELVEEVATSKGGKVLRYWEKQ